MNSAIKYAGDDRPERLGREQKNLARRAIRYLSDRHALSLPDTSRAYDMLGRSRPKELVSPETTIATIQLLLQADARYHDFIRDNPESADLAKHQVTLDHVRRAIRATGRRLVESGVKWTWLPYDIWVVALDQTSCWAIPDTYKPHIEAIRGLYFFDRNTLTHCCSFTASYWLQQIDDQSICRDGIPENLKDEIDEWVGEGRDPNDAYYDEHDIDRLLATNKPGTVYHYGNPGFDLDELQEDVLNDWQSSLRQHPEWERRTLLPEEIDDRIETKVMDAVRESLQSNAVL